MIEALFEVQLSRTPAKPPIKFSFRNWGAQFFDEYNIWHHSAMKNTVTLPRQEAGGILA
jgi:hypothetical protein